MTDKNDHTHAIEIDPISERFVLCEEGDGAEEAAGEAELRFHVHGERLSLIHTGVPPALEGRGIGGALVRAAVDFAAARGLTVVPYCPFARRWLEGHPEVAASVSIAWP